MNLVDTAKEAERDARELAEKLAEGYAATREEGLELCKEFEAADLENWGKY